MNNPHALKIGTFSLTTVTSPEDYAELATVANQSPDNLGVALSYVRAISIIKVKSSEGQTLAYIPQLFMLGRPLFPAGTDTVDRAQFWNALIEHTRREGEADIYIADAGVPIADSHPQDTVPVTKIPSEVKQ